MTRILVVDDEELLRFTIRDILENEGYEVLEAAEGQAALDSLQTTPVDLVITDLIMPKMEGLSAIRAIRENHPTLPVIAISGSGRLKTTDVLSDAVRVGATTALQKPFTETELLMTVEDLLKSR